MADQAPNDPASRSTWSKSSTSSPGCSARCSQDLGREPTPDELARELDMTPERSSRSEYGRGADFAAHSSRGGRRQRVRRPDRDSGAVVPADAVSFTLLQEQLHSVLDTLSEREAGWSPCVSGSPMAEDPRRDRQGLRRDPRADPNRVQDDEQAAAPVPLAGLARLPGLSVGARPGVGAVLGAFLARAARDPATHGRARARDHLCGRPGHRDGELAPPRRPLGGQQPRLRPVSTPPGPRRGGHDRVDILGQGDAAAGRAHR